MFRLFFVRKFLCLGLLVSIASLACLEANERHFTYAYESGVLAPGAKEFELWSTFRTGRKDFYSRFDYRAEFEMGLTNRLMTSFYLNWQDIAEEDTSVSPSVIKKEFEFKGISSEWKYKMTDPVANKIGSALYGEVSLGTDEMELEGKVILDKRMGNNLVAYNFAVEGEWEREPTEWEYEETSLDNTLAWTHFLKPNLGTGLELRNHTEFTTKNHPEHSALFLGPVVSYSTETWWVAFTSMWQLPAIKRSVNDKDEALVLDEHEKFNARLLLSFHI